MEQVKGNRLNMSMSEIDGERQRGRGGQEMEAEWKRIGRLSEEWRRSKREMRGEEGARTDASRRKRGKELARVGKSKWMKKNE